MTPPTHKALEAVVADLREVEAYFDDRADAEQHPGDSCPTGDEEMRMLVTMRSCIATLALLTATPAREPVAWMPIESAPKDGSRVLLLGSGLRPFVGRYDSDDGWLDERDLYRDPRQWLPIPPAAPEQAAK